MVSSSQPAPPLRPVLILGASARAAAQSAIRAGLSPICIDQFADADLRAVARVLEIADYPRGAVAAAALAPACPWMYMGGIENHARLVERISAGRPLWGNGPAVLRAVRDPWAVARVLEQSGLPACRVVPRGARPPADVRWLLKPLNGAGGRGIRVWEGCESERGELAQGVFFQEHRRGSSCSAVFIAFPEMQPEPRTLLLGITRQLVGIDAVHAPAFAWCGNIAPLRPAEKIVTAIRRVGECIGRGFALRGLFGCDFVVDEDTAWLTEVNPRYPASTELLEWALDVPLIDWHRRACEAAAEEQRLQWADCLARVAKPQAEGVAGKIVLYADRAIVAPDLARFIAPGHEAHLDDRACRTLPYLADIPSAGTQIHTGLPIATLYARGRSESECRAKLLRRAERFDASLF